MLLSSVAEKNLYNTQVFGLPANTSLVDQPKENITQQIVSQAKKKKSAKAQDARTVSIGNAPNGTVISGLEDMSRQHYFA